MIKVIQYLMKFEEAIDIFDNCSKLMLVTTYKRLCRLNRTKMMEVTNDMKKILPKHQYMQNII